jgi:hypothetical protein
MALLFEVPSMYSEIMRSYACPRALDVIIAIATTQATTANPRAKSDLSTAILLWNSGETIPSDVLSKSRNVPIPTPRP